MLKTKNRLFASCCIYIIAFLCMAVGSFVRGNEGAPVATGHGYTLVNSGAPPGDIVRWSRGYNPEDIKQLLQAVPELEQKLRQDPESSMLLVQVDRQYLQSPAELELAVITPSLTASLLFSWLPIVGSLVDNGQSRKLRIPLEHINDDEEAYSRYLETLPGQVDWANSFVINAVGKRISLSAATSGETMGGAESLMGLKLVEIRPARDTPEQTGDDSDSFLPLSDSALKDTLLGDGTLTIGGGGGGFGGDFGPDHRPGGGGGGGGVQTENTLWIMRSPPPPLRLITMARKLEDGSTVLLQAPSEGLMVQTVSASGWILEEKEFSAEAILALLQNSDSLTGEHEEYAHSLAEDGVRLQTRGELTQTLKSVLLAGADTHTGCQSGNIPGMNSCPRDGKTGGKVSNTGGRRDSSGARGQDQPGESGSQPGQSGYGGGGAGSGRRDDEDEGEDSEGSLTPDEEGEGVEQVRSKPMDTQEALEERDLAILKSEHDDAVEEWNASSNSLKIDWIGLRQYLPEQLNDEDYLVLVSKPGPNTFKEVARLIIKDYILGDASDDVSAYNDHLWVSGYSVLQLQLKVYLEYLRDEESPNKRALKRYFGRQSKPTDSKFYHYFLKRHLEPLKIKWSELDQIALVVFHERALSGDPLMRLATQNSEKHIRFFISEFIKLRGGPADFSSDARINGDVGKNPIGIELLISKLEAPQHVVLMALAGFEHFKNNNPKKARNISHYEDQLDKAMMGFLRKSWMRQNRGSGPRKAMARLSMAVMGKSFLRQSAAHRPVAQQVVVSPAPVEIPQLPPVRAQILQQRPTMTNLQLLKSDAHGLRVYLIQKLAPHYEKFFPRLMYRGDNFVAIAQANGQNAESIVSRGFRKWLEMEPTASWQNILDALQDLELHTLAFELANVLSRLPYHPRESDKVELSLLHNFDGINVIVEIGIHYSSFGTLLLDDQTGALVSSIRLEKMGNPVLIVEEIFKQWIATNRYPTWGKLTRCLRNMQLNSLAGDLEKKLGR